MTNTHRNKLLKRFYMIFIMQALGANFAHPCTPTLIGNLGLNDYMFGVAFACMAFGSFVFAPFWGKLSDRVGRMNLLMITGIGYGIGQGLFGISTTEIAIAFARFFAGCFAGGFFAVQLSYLMDITTDQTRGKHFTISMTFNSAFSAIGYLIGGFLGEISIGLMFICQTAVLALSGILFAKLLKDSEEKNFVKSIPRKDIVHILKTSNPFVTLSLRGEKMTKTMVILSIGALVCAFGSTAYEQCFNYYIKDVYFFSPSYNGILKAALGFITLIVNFTIGLRLMRKSNLKNSFMLCVLLNGLAMSAIILTGEVVGFILLNIFVFSVNAIYMPLQQTLYAESATGDDNGKTMGVFNSIKSFGNIFGALMAGMVYGFGPDLSFIMAGVAFLAIAVLTFMHEQNKKNKKQSNQHTIRL